MTSVIFLSLYSFYVFQQHITTIDQDGTATEKKPKKANHWGMVVKVKTNKEKHPHR
ncbi:hypothetical protein [Methylophaga sp.]|uniref:hypothetical protein n=1 Tax=Methylophaga sp. TaxID=2024840 RepID=UPI003A90F6EE